MPRGVKLRFPVEFVKWRMDSDDLDLIRTLHGSDLNDFARQLFAAYANRLRAQLAAPTEQPPEPSE